MIRRHALAVIAVTGLLAACTASETRTPARIVMSGPIEAVTAQAVAAADATHGQLHVAPGAAKGTAEATLTLPANTRGDKVLTAWTHCVEAKLSCALHGASVSRQVRGSLG
jgi:anti-sigma-K factor RskA